MTSRVALQRNEIATTKTMTTILFGKAPIHEGGERRGEVIPEVAHKNALLIKQARVATSRRVELLFTVAAVLP